jgi:hypothetical protein
MPADFAKVRLEIAQGTATYLLCGRPVCIRETIARAEDNLLRASGKQREVAAGEQEKAKARKVIIAPSRPIDT